MVNESLGLLGKPARDKVTGFSGVVTSVSFDLYGCVCGILSPPVDEKGKVAEGRWFDIQRLEVTGAPVMPVPHFAAVPTKPAEYAHGAAEKPIPDR